MRTVVVSTDRGRTVLDGPTAAWGPYGTGEQAAEVRAALEATVSGTHRVVNLRYMPSKVPMTDTQVDVVVRVTLLHGTGRKDDPDYVAACEHEAVEMVKAAVAGRNAIWQRTTFVSEGDVKAAGS